jgi:dTDP-D-glucose 4,6-dehydratase
VLTNCSNNYGPFHFPEKLIPLFINNIICKPLPIYGRMKYTHDWLLWDHAVCYRFEIFHGVNHETVWWFNEWQNIDLVKLLCQIMDRSWGILEFPEQLISCKKTVGHDLLCYWCQQNKARNWDGRIQLLLSRLEERCVGIWKTRLVEYGRAGEYATFAEAIHKLARIQSN